MKTIAIILFGCGVAFSANAQNINVTFSAAVDTTTIDSVTATNLRTDQNVTFPGDATLVLTKIAGMPDYYSELKDRIDVFPNPFSGNSKVRVTIDKPQNVRLRVQNTVGQVVAQSKEFLQPGSNEFVFSINDSGIYTIAFETEEGSVSNKIVCLASSGQGNKIHFNGWSAGLKPKSTSSGTQSFKSGFSLDYAVGDIIHFTCFSGVMTTIVTDIPTADKNHEVEFAYCTDPDGQHYKIVKIGDQTWMAENLAYLPLVSPSDTGSDTEKHYYVYDYQGNSVRVAMSQAYYTTYGVLYNWEASRTACPEGWHLPSDAEWRILTDYLSNNGYGYGGSGSDIGKSMASTSGWTTNSSEGTIGNDQGTNNRSGFTALPGGYRLYDGGFYDLGVYATFWSSSEGGSDAWYRNLFCDYGVVVRYSLDRRYGFSVRCLQNN